MGGGCCGVGGSCGCVDVVNSPSMGVKMIWLRWLTDMIAEKKKVARQTGP